MPSTHAWIVDGRDFLAAASIPAIPPELAARLSDGERARLQRFPKTQRAREFLLGRLLLRHALTQVLGCAASDIVVTERAGASPLVEVDARPADGRSLPGLSISHSRGWLVCAVGVVCGIGVDIEAQAPQRDLASLAGLAFTAHENAWLNGQARYEAAFYRLWCAKEALYKLRHNAGMRETPTFPELDCGAGAPGVAGAFLHHETRTDYHLCLCSAMPPERHASQHLDCSSLLNLSAG